MFSFIFYSRLCSGGIYTMVGCIRRAPVSLSSRYCSLPLSSALQSLRDWLVRVYDLFVWPTAIAGHDSELQRSCKSLRCPQLFSMQTSARFLKWRALAFGQSTSFSRVSRCIEVSQSICIACISFLSLLWIILLCIIAYGRWDILDRPESQYNKSALVYPRSKASCRSFHCRSARDEHNKFINVAYFVSLTVMTRSGNHWHFHQESYVNFDGGLMERGFYFCWLQISVHSRNLLGKN